MTPVPALSISGQPLAPGPPRMLNRVIRGKKAWTRATIGEADYVLPMPQACLDELDRMIATLRQHPLDTLLLTPQDYPLAACHRYMTQVKQVLDRGVGFALVDRLAVRRYTKAELKAIYWVLSSMLARPVAQAFKGTMLYDVIDTGQKMNERVRADLTNQGLHFHTDYGYNRPPPYFGLQVLRTARKGGRSSVISLYAAHNQMRRRYPDLLPRLYRPFYLNRYGEHAAGESLVTYRPIFEYVGKVLQAQFNRRNVEAGYALMGKMLDREGKAAIDALSDVLNDKALRVDFTLKTGQIEYVFNYQCAHGRTAYEDADDPNKKRHLVRIFLRNDGAQSYMG